MKRNKLLPVKSIERLCLYRRVLHSKASGKKKFIFSHELASILNTTSSVVRRDIMNIGYIGTPKSGYRIDELLRCLNDFFNTSTAVNVVIFGLGNIGKALISYFSMRPQQFNIVACFDSAPIKVGSTFEGCRCYSIKDFSKVAEQKVPQIGIISTPASAAQEIAETMESSGIHSILNFSTATLRTNEETFVENVDINVLLEKIYYFGTLNKEVSANCF